MSNYLVDGADLTSVANAIRTKGGTSASLAFPTGFVDAIDAISGGGNQIYMTQYTMTGDTTIKQFVDNISYAVHSTTCMICIRSNGSSPTTSGSYTINNYIAVFDNGVLKKACDCLVNGKAAPSSVQPFPLTGESITFFHITNGVLTTSYTGSSCLATNGSVITLVEIDLPDDFWNILTAVTLLT